MTVYAFTKFDDPAAVATSTSGATTSATSINDADQIVGYYFTYATGVDHGFLDNGGTFTTLDHPAATEGTFASGINASGLIVGSYRTGTGEHGFLYNPATGTYSTIEVPTAVGSNAATGINAAGTIVGTYYDAGSHGFLYDPNAGTYTRFDYPAAVSTVPDSINASGLIVGSYGSDRVHGFFYNLNTGTFTTIDDPLAQFGTQLHGINDAGVIVGQYDATHGFIYVNGAFTPVDVPGASWTNVTGINNNGHIVGFFSDNTGLHGFLAMPQPNPPPPADTTADMILRGVNGSVQSGQYEIYDLTHNTVLAAYSLGQVGTNWRFVTLGGFTFGDTTDMMLRDGATGGLEIYNISNNNVTNAAFLGAVGLDWQAAAFGNFSSRGETDMIMRNMSNGSMVVYDIANNQVTDTFFLGNVGLDWQIVGVGNHGIQSDMMMRNVNTGELELYNVINNQVASASFLGAVGLDWQVVGFGNFSRTPGGEGDMMMRNLKTGAFEIYDIRNNAVTDAFVLGAVGLDWQVAGFGPINGQGAVSDMLLRNGNSGSFQVYDLDNNVITGTTSLGAVGLDWQVGGIAIDPPVGEASGSTGSADDANALLVQGMAGWVPAAGGMDQGGSPAVPDGASEPNLFAASPLR
jgi:hypothetical protein